MGKTAIILGATGLTGGILLRGLIKNVDYDKVKLFSRSTVGLDHPKIEEYLINLFELTNYSAEFTGDVVFCCIGTTKAKTSDTNTYKKIDYGIPVAAAQLAKENQIKTFIVISAMGANPNSGVFYNRVKGEMEAEILKQEMPRTYILQPSLIGGKRVEKRFGEQLAKGFMSVFGFLIPKRYKMIEPEDIATAMQLLAVKGPKEQRISSDVITNIATDN